jgi:hypothetical protein
VPKRETSGYSGTPLPQKLGIKEGHSVAYLNAPDDFAELMHPMPDDVTITTRASGRKDVIVLFVTSEADLKKRFPAAKKALNYDGGLWFAYPKKASGVTTDLKFENAQAIGLDGGLVDNKSCAIDEIWSGLRFVYRLKDRPY